MQDPENHHYLRLSGPLTVPQADALLARVVDALASAEAVTIDVSAATDIDVSFLQILIAARKTATQDRKILTIAAAGADALVREITRCGLSLTTSPSGVHALPYLTTETPQ